MTGLYDFVAFCFNFSPDLRRILLALFEVQFKSRLQTNELVLKLKNKYPLKYRVEYYAFMLFEIRTKTPLTKFLHACPASISRFGWKTRKETWEHIFIVNFHKSVVASYSIADSVVECALKPGFCYISESLPRNYCLIVIL